MPRYVPVSTNAAIIFAAPDSMFHPGFWQSSFFIEYNETDNRSPNSPTITSPAGGENIGSRYFSITWNEASPIDPDGAGGTCSAGDCIQCYAVYYSVNGGSTWFQAYDNYGDPITCEPQGTTSIVFDLGSIPDTTQGKIRLCATDTYGCTNSTTCADSNIFTISGGTCF